MWKLAPCLAGLTLAAAVSAPRAQVTTATPVHHGRLLIRPAAATIDNTTGIGKLRIRQWRLQLAEGSNGIFPGSEPIVVAAGEESFVLPQSPTPSHNGKVFRYRAPAGAGPRAFSFFLIKRRPNGACAPGIDRPCYSVSFTLTGIDLSQLVLQNPVCLPLAVIVGDDDGFSGVDLTRRGHFNSPHVAIPRTCTPPSWPWTQ
jgi:hypothetical protein